MAEEWLELDAETPSFAGLELLEFMMKNIKGQDQVLKNLVDAIEVHESGLFTESRPIYVGLFLGPSGVGKTLMAEVLAEYWFGSRKAFTKVPCEAYSEEHAIAKLIGSPAGYVGHWHPNDPRGEGTPPILWQENIDRFAVDADPEMAKRRDAFDNELQKEMFMGQKILALVRERFDEHINPQLSKEQKAEQFEKKLALLAEEYMRIDKRVAKLFYEQDFYKVPRPRSVILFDEIEKASPTLHNILLNVIDKAELQLANGMVTKFDNSVILMTSNISSKAIAGVLSAKQKMGFAPEKDSQSKDKDKLDKEIYEKSMEAAYNFFPPEFLARIDRISVFRPLSEETMREILDVELGRFQTAVLGSLPLLLQVDKETKEFILKEATDRPQNGARLIKLKINKYLRKQICRLKNKKLLKEGDILKITLSEDKKIAFFVQKRPS